MMQVLSYGSRVLGEEPERVHTQLLVLLSPVFLLPYAVLLSMDGPPSPTAPVLLLQLCAAFVCLFIKKHFAM